MLRIGGIVLCGGQSKRMGQSKAWLPFGGELMLQRVVRILSEAVQPVVVVAAPGQEVPTLPDTVSIFRDEVAGRGPLQGLAAGLTALRGEVEAAYISSCDVPFLQSTFVRRLLDLLGDNSICVPLVGGYHHPLSAVYRIDVREAVQSLLAEDRFRPVFLFERVDTRIVEADELKDFDPSFQSLRNLNSWEEYKAALTEIGTSSFSREPPASAGYDASKPLSRPRSPVARG